MTHHGVTMSHHRNESQFQWKPSDEEKLEMSGEGHGQHDLYDQREHGYSEHDREMGYDREQKGYLAGGEGSDREMGYISSEPSLQEFIPHQMDPDNTPPPTGYHYHHHH